ncbi:MAG: hypothetical protein M0R76_14770 [Proteobacteria bacterium]|nr:hypothetical protein [Pseudomonadota bacterium]
MDRMKLVFGALGVLFLLVSLGCYTFESVDVYSDQQVPYKETQYRTETTYLPPIIERDGLVLAFTPMRGAERATIERVSEAVRLGFLREGDWAAKSIDFVSDSDLLMVLKHSALNDFGQDVLWRIEKDFTVNVLGTGTIMLDSASEKRLSMQAFDLAENETYNKVYSGTSWENVGIQIAQDFYGTREVLQQVPYQVQKYRTERVLSGQKKVRVPSEKGKNALLIGLLVVSVISGTIYLISY